ncbi:hypothetical protein ACP70R_018208 [Stipagrostis hirtigluma subsp. patula]
MASAAAAAAVRLLRRRQAVSLSLARLLPLFPSPYSKPRSPLMATAAVGCFPGVDRARTLPSSLVPSVLRHYSSKDERCYNTVSYTETEVMDWFRDRVFKDLDEALEMMKEAVVTLQESTDLLDAGLEDKACVMLGKGIDDGLKAVALFEKGLDDLAKGFGNTKGMPMGILEPNRILCKELENFLKSMRQTLMKLSCSVEAKKTLQEFSKWLTSVNVRIGACLLLSLLITIGIYLA